MSEDSEQRAPLTPEERAERVQLARERAAAARAAREGGAPPPAPAQPVAAAPAQATESTAAAPVEAARSAAPAEPAPRAERSAPLSVEERAAAVEAARARAAAARAAREGGTAPAPAAPQPARAAMSDADRAAALAQAQERAAAIRAQRATAVAPAARGAATATAVPEAAPAWRVGPGGVTTPILAARPETRTLEAASLSPLQRMVVRRRQLLSGGFWAGLAMLTVGGLAQTLDLMNPRDIHGFGSVITVPSALVPKPGQDPYHYIEGKLWLVNLKPGEGVPEQFLSVAPPSKNGGLLALYQKCVHLGCTVPWRSDFVFEGVTGWFRCPCHGSTYTKGGVRVFGPAPRSLDTFAILKVDSSGVAVNTGKITLGNTSDPQRAVPPGPYT